jgi:hypothetical protein
MDIQARLRKIFQQIRGVNVAPATIMTVDDIIDVLAEIDRKVELLWIAKSMEERINSTLNQEITICCKPVESTKFSAPMAQSHSAKIPPTSKKAKTRTARKAKKQKAKSEDV